MRKSMIFCFLSLVLVLPGRAQEDKKESGTQLTGYVVDAMCAKGMAKKGDPMEKAAMHTRQCALDEACAASGFGVFSDGKWIKFDEKGDALALELIKGSKTEKGLMVEVKGEMKGEMFAVAEIKEHMMKTKEE